VTPPPGTVVLWSLPVPPPGRAEAWTGALSAEEGARADRFRLAADRAAYVAAHALLRALLAAHGVPRPRFAAGPWGRPELADAAVPLRFSLTHTRRLVAAAVAWRDDVGVDAETTDPALDATGLAARFFAPAEAAMLRNLPVPARPDTFCRLWTLKEAFAKAVGRGLSVPLDAFAFGPRGDDFACPGDLGGAESWSFATRPTKAPGHLSVALRVPRRPGLRPEEARLAPEDLDRLLAAARDRDAPALTACARRGMAPADANGATTP
jgi:4'-phosphopantetheinyl transferase